MKVELKILLFSIVNNQELLPSIEVKLNWLFSSFKC
jgi:hypothetical protein